MGYRNYLYVADRKKFNKFRKLNAEQMWDLVGKDKAFDEEDLEIAPWYYDIKETIGLEEVFEFGKYIDFYDRIKQYLKPAFKDKNIQKQYNEEEEFMIAKPEIIQECMTIFKEKIETYYKDLLNEKSSDEYDKRTRQERLIGCIKDHLCWVKFLDYLPDNKWNLGGGWLYEHEVFTLMHIARIFNPKKYVLLWLGY